MPGHAAPHGRTSSSILQHSQGTDGSFLQNPNECCCCQLDPDWWLLSFTHSCWSWTQSYFLHTKPNVLLQKSSVFIELTIWTKYTAYIVYLFCKQLLLLPNTSFTNLPSAPGYEILKGSSTLTFDTVLFWLLHSKSQVLLYIQNTLFCFSMTVTQLKKKKKYQSLCIYIYWLNLLTVCKTLEELKVYLHYLRICWCS